MPEIGLGLGRCTLPTDPINREALGWFNQQGQRYPTPAELAEQGIERAEQERQRAERLAEKLRELGIDPDSL
ncbi:hypothetical protein [Phormidium sp. FACHB-1136]|uniref:hypothetical protein n=1 Tax=Phormidium sp. FACHB-1136 TaxID=2692848 RepID=UPI001687588D|nr:hypothetical protein [Phormidium sp. FACHB-1136]MBD2428749.1 hypothetical protein [Phormidium sp. FACHB-1136]